MAWDFSTDPEFQTRLDWMDRFVTDEVEPLDLVFRGPADPFDPARAGPAAAMAPLKAGGTRTGALGLSSRPGARWPGLRAAQARSHERDPRPLAVCATVFGTQAPDTGNAEILARFGTPEQKRRYLEPLINGEIASCYSMTEPQAGSDPRSSRAARRLPAGTWVINGEKWFASHADFAPFLLVVVGHESRRADPRGRLDPDRGS